MVQKYADEHVSVWEDVKHGFIYGSQEFIADFKTRFLDDKSHVELPQYNRLFRAADPQELLNSIAVVLGFDLEAARKSMRIASGEKLKRDMLIHLLWKVGHVSNHEIGDLLGMTYSTVSKAVSDFRRKLKGEKGVRSKIELLFSQFKV